MSDPREYRDNALSRIYREGSWPEPNRQIDDAILAASRRAARERHSFMRRWAPPFALAATVVLTSAVVLRAVQERPEVIAESPPDTGAARVKQAPANPAEKAKAATEAKPAPAQAPSPVAAPPGFALQMDTAEAERLERMQRDLGVRQNFPASESQAAGAKAQLADKAAPALKKEASAATRADAPQRRFEPQQESRVRSAVPLREQQPANAPISVFGAPPPAPAQAPVPPSVPAPAPAPAAAPAPALTTGAVTGALSATAAKAERSPQTWLEDIRKLVGEGRLQEADRELAEFKKRYPDYVLPEDLR